jgi:hypothetical protein
MPEPHPAISSAATITVTIRGVPAPWRARLAAERSGMLPRPILDRLVKPLGRLDDRDKRALQVDPLVSIAEHDDWVCFDESVDERCVPARSFPNRFRERELAHVHSAGGLLRGDDRAASVKPHDGAMGS